MTFIHYWNLLVVSTYFSNNDISFSFIMFCIIHYHIPYMQVPVLQYVYILISLPLLFTRTQRYKEDDIYMVTDLPEGMLKEWMVPRFMLCGGYTKHLMYVYMW